MRNRSSVYALLCSALLTAGAFVAGCGASNASDDASSIEQEAVSDIAQMTARGDGTFDVTCRDGRREVVNASDVESGRVCKAAATPASPFAANACTGTPMTADGALSRLAGATSTRIGSFVLGLRHRECDHQFVNGRWTVTSCSWKGAPTDHLVAWRETETSYAAHATFGDVGAVELAVDAKGEPYVRLVGDAANVNGPDTTRFMRIASEPFRPWKTQRSGPRFYLEESHGADGTWARVTEYGWSVQTNDGTYRRSWWFEGSDVTAIMTESCGQFISAQPLSKLSPISAALGLYLTLD